MSATDLLWLAGSALATLTLIALVWRLKTKPRRKRESEFTRWCRKRGDFYGRMR